MLKSGREREFLLLGMEGVLPFSDREGSLFKIQLPRSRAACAKAWTYSTDLAFPTYH